MNYDLDTFQEEEGEEYAAYYPGTGDEAHAEEVQLVQPLGEGSAEGHGSSEEAKLVTLCRSELISVTGASQHGACARYVSLCYKGAFGRCGRFVKQSIHSNFSRSDWHLNKDALREEELKANIEMEMDEVDIEAEAYAGDE